MSRRTKIIIGAVVVIIGLVLALVLSDWFLPQTPEFPDEGDLTSQQPAGTTPPSTLPAALINQPIKTLTPIELSLYNTARNFAERYGSFSTDSNFANLEEVKLFASAKMISELEAMIAVGQPATGFYGVTSKVLNVEIEELNEGAGLGRAMVTLQRQETKADGSSRVYYQDLELYLIKSGDNWLVDSAQWLS